MIRDFAAIVPVFDPEPGLRVLCDGLVRAFDTVVVVDDGSVRNRQTFDELPRAVTHLRHAVNRGKGAAMKTALGWLMANRPELRGGIFADGDGQHRLDDIVSVALTCLEKEIVTFGVRNFSAKGVPFRSWWGNRWTAWEVRLLFGYRLDDTQTGLRAVPSRLFPALVSLSGERFEYEAGWFGRLRGLGERIAHVPIATIYRASNRDSHFRPWRDTWLTQRSLFSGLSGRFPRT